MTDWLPGEPNPIAYGPGWSGRRKAVHHERIIARPDQPGPWKGASELIAGN